MGLTITNREDHSASSLRGVSATVAFDDSYATGGESLTPGDLGIGEFVGPIEITQGEDGYVFKWDSANEKIVVYRIGAGTLTATAEAPPFVQQEALTVAADAGTLAYVPAYIVSVTDGAGTNYAILPSTGTPVDNVSVAVNFTTGVLTFAAADDPSGIKVSYFPSRAGTFFDNANAVEENLTGTDGTGYVDFTSRAACVQYVYDSTAPQRLPFSPVGEAPADNQVEVDINRSAASSIKNHSGENGSTIAVRYLLHSALTPGILFVDQTDVALSSGDKDWSGTAGISGRDLLVVPGFGENVVGEETGDGNENAVLGDKGTTEADGIARWNPEINLIATANTSAFVTTAISWLNVDLDLMVAPTPAGTIATAGLAEVSSGVNLSAVEVEIFARGR